MTENLFKLSPNRLTDNHRLLLERRWIGGVGTANWIMLNPSTADDFKDDPTIRKCIGFSKRWGFAGLVVTNLFTLRATKPKDMKDCAKVDWARAVGLADGELIKQASLADIVVAAWGTHGAFMGRAEDVMNRVLPTQEMHCIGLTKDGLPVHPLMASYTEAPTRFLRP